jgi:hypothetical protein
MMLRLLQLRKAMEVVLKWGLVAVLVAMLGVPWRDASAAPSHANYRRRVLGACSRTTEGPCAVRVRSALSCTLSAAFGMDDEVDNRR